MQVMSKGSVSEGFCWLDNLNLGSYKYRQLIGSLMYLVNTRPDIFFVVNTLSQFMVELRHFHWVATKHVLRYLCGTIGYGMRYDLGGEVRLQGYTDFDWAGSAVDRKSTSGCCFNLGSTMISWFSRKQTSVALNTTRSGVYHN
jgi:hypothetical protein